MPEVFVGLGSDLDWVQQVIVIRNEVREGHHEESQGRDDHADAAPQRPLLHLHRQR